MSGFLLDTNVISEPIRAKPEPRVLEWIRSTDENLLYLSVLTLGEIRKGIGLHPDRGRRVKLEAWLAGELVPRFGARILTVDENVADRWGRITAEAGQPVSVIDALLAATALEHNLTLVTRNTQDVSALPVSTFNPWLR